MNLSLFPLSATLLPHGRMPLQIFERRYLDLVKDSMRREEGFGIVHLRRGAEVGDEGLPDLAPVGTLAHIVDWDQLDNGLLGITVAGRQRFRIQRHWRAESGLVCAEVELLPEPGAAPMREAWSGLADLLRGLEAHPHVQRIGLQVDFDDAWQVAYTLLQVLPLDEGFKAALLETDDVAQLMHELDSVLGDISGEDVAEDPREDT
jgi:Lon protease-like protein